MYFLKFLIAYNVSEDVSAEPTRFHNLQYAAYWDEVREDMSLLTPTPARILLTDFRCHISRRVVLADLRLLLRVGHFPVDDKVHQNPDFQQENGSPDVHPVLRSLAHYTGELFVPCFRCNRRFELDNGSNDVTVSHMFSVHFSCTQSAKNTLKKYTVVVRCDAELTFLCSLLRCSS